MSFCVIHFSYTAKIVHILAICYVVGTFQYAYTGTYIHYIQVLYGTMYGVYVLSPESGESGESGVYWLADGRRNF